MLLTTRTPVLLRYRLKDDKVGSTETSGLKAQEQKEIVRPNILIVLSHKKDIPDWSDGLTPWIDATDCPQRADSQKIFTFATLSPLRPPLLDFTPAI